MNLLKTLGLTALTAFALAGTANSANPGLSYEYRPATAISSNGLEYIKAREKYSPTNYVCATGHKTIGYGHVVIGGEKFDYMDKPEAEVLLLKDLTPVEKAISDRIKVPLTVNEYDALASFAHNVGVNAFTNSTLVKVINEGKKNEAREQFMRWVKGTNPKTGKKEVIRGLVNRRQMDADLFYKN